MWVQRHLHPAAGRAAGGRRWRPGSRRSTARCAALEAQPLTARARLRARPAGRRGATDASSWLARSWTPAGAAGDAFELYRALRRFATRAGGALPAGARVRARSAAGSSSPGGAATTRWSSALRDGAMREDGVRVGVLHGDNERDAARRLLALRPRVVGRAHAMPLVVALHGGHGHGRDFLWSWLREARARGMLAALPHRARSHLVDHGRRRGRRGAAGDDRSGGGALPRRSHARATDRHVRRRHLRAARRMLRRRGAVHAPGAGLRRAAPFLLGGGARPCGGPAHLPRPRRARLDVPRGHRPRRQRGPRSPPAPSWSTAKSTTSRTRTPATRTPRSSTGWWPAPSLGHLGG